MERSETAPRFPLRLRTYREINFLPSNSQMREEPLRVLLGVGHERALVILVGEVVKLVFVFDGRDRGTDGDLAAIDRVHGDGRSEGKGGAQSFVLRGRRRWSVSLSEAGDGFDGRRFVRQHR